MQLYALSYAWPPPTTCLGGCGKEKYSQNYQLSSFEIHATEFLGGLTRYLQSLFNRQHNISSGKTLLADKDILREAGIDSNSDHVLNRRLRNLSTEIVRELKNLLKNSRTTFLKGLSNPALDEPMAIEIPTALVEILQTHPESAGLFTALSTRGPGARPWIVNLNNPKSPIANGAAYELLATRKLMHNAADDFKLYASDKIAFGPKLQACYEHSDLKAEELLGALKQIAPLRWEDIQEQKTLARRTVESDLAIYRGDREIFVDFKHTSKNIRWIEPAELLGIAVAISTGEIDEVHFVCNASLSENSLRRINDINTLLIHLECGTIKAHQNYQW